MKVKNDHPHLIVNPFVLYVGFGLSAALLQNLVALPFAPTQTAQITGITIMATNLLFGLPALRGMLQAKTSPNPNRPTTTLLLSGPYRFSRNPMYVGLTLIYVGLMTFLQLPWGILFTPIVIWLITAWVIRPEEEYLASKFGDTYLEYKKIVRRWI
ncbi:MAG: isoprenylcysteine carboxylmethyltransferase family protein [Anaerolineales bacterium]|nr:isoprenylcysteine carboxylmethyltransferase family protein [Anaerolineales bacterium]